MFPIYAPCPLIGPDIQITSTLKPSCTIRHIHSKKQISPSSNWQAKIYLKHKVLLKICTRMALNEILQTFLWIPEPFISEPPVTWIPWNNGTSIVNYSLLKDVVTLIFFSSLQMNRLYFEPFISQSNACVVVVPNCDSLIGTESHIHRPMYELLLMKKHMNIDYLFLCYWAPPVFKFHLNGEMHIIKCTKICVDVLNGSRRNWDRKTMFFPW